MHRQSPLQQLNDWIGGHTHRSRGNRPRCTRGPLGRHSVHLAPGRFEHLRHQPFMPIANPMRFLFGDIKAVRLQINRTDHGRYSFLFTPCTQNVHGGYLSLSLIVGDDAQDAIAPRQCRKCADTRLLCSSLAETSPLRGPMALRRSPPSIGNE